MKYAASLSAFCFFAFLSSPFASEGPASGRSDLGVGSASFAGYAKSYLIGLFPREIEGVPEGISSNPGAQLFSAFRIIGYFRPAEKLKLEGAYEIQPVWQTSLAAQREQSSGGLSSALPLSRGVSYRLIDFDTEIAAGANGRNYRLYQNMDRLVAYWFLDQVDITLGRQAITFGSARAIQTTDVLLPYTFQQVSTEYRIGVDAVRAQIPLSAMSELDLGLVLGHHASARESAAFIRSRISIFETDATGIAMLFSGAKLLGGGLQRGIGPLGYSLDFAQVWADADENYFRLSNGLDYAFESGFFAFIEYHFNGAGVNAPADYLSVADRFAIERGGVYLLGRHYLIPGLAYPLSPLISARLQALINAQDGSIYLSGGMDYGAKENLFFDLGMSAAFGASPQWSGTGALLRSEFGSYPLQAYGAVRYYF